jgi:hypothetical protein
VVVEASPHDTHDWDATQVPVLIDGEFDGQKRKMVALAARNGYHFLLDRTNGKNLVTTQYIPVNWAKGVDKTGVPIPDPAKMPQIDGALVSPNQGGATNWPPPTFSPQTSLFYVGASRAFMTTAVAILRTCLVHELCTGPGRSEWRSVRPLPTRPPVRFPPPRSCPPPRRPAR